jgi:L-ascorbate metabolism protein UlaG (beta-lactamase superfamily)
MDKKIYGIGMVAILVISVVSLYIAFAGTNKSDELETTLGQTAERIDEQIQEILPRTPRGYAYAGLAVSYVIEFENGVRFFFPGGSGFSYDFKALVGDFLKPDVSFLPIGNYYTMDAEVAAYSASMINPEGTKYIIPTHYGTSSCPMVDKNTYKFREELEKYDLPAEVVEFEDGDEKEIMGIKVLCMGHSNWLFESPGGARMIVDPAVQYNMSIPEKLKDLTQYKKVDLLLLTQAHFDHSSVQDLQRWAKLYQPIIICPYELGIYMKEYVDTPILAMNIGANIGKEAWPRTAFDPESYKDIENLRIWMINGVHSTSITPAGQAVSVSGQYGGSPGEGYMLNE